MDIKDILARCDHTLLRTDCTAAEIREAVQFQEKYHNSYILTAPEQSRTATTE